jgi:hypothetical protein
MQNDLLYPVSVQIPSDARVNGFYATTQLADAYAINLPADAMMVPEVLARFMFESQPVWATKLMQFRDVAVSVFGLKTAKQLMAPSADRSEKRIAIFKIYESSAHEVFLGEDDSHLNFRISAQVRPATLTSAPQFIVSSVVQCNNLVGRAYITLIAPFHRAIVQAALRRAAKLGWPKVATA